MDVIDKLDTQLFLFLNGLNSPFWDQVMWFISGKKEWIPLYLVLLGWIIYRFRWRTILMIPFLVLMIVLSDQISGFLKAGVERLRPSRDPSISEFVHIVNNYRGGLYGFVSAHAANSFALASFTSLLFRVPWYSIAIFFWAALVSYSRIYLGVHYPGDILGGFLLGILVGTFVFRAWEFADSKVYRPKA